MCSAAQLTYYPESSITLCCYMQMVNSRLDTSDLIFRWGFLIYLEICDSQNRLLYLHVIENTDFVMKDFSPDFVKQSLKLPSWEQNLFWVWSGMNF